VDWGIGWHIDLSLHKHSTSVHPVMGSEQLESSEHSDFLQQGSKNCWARNHLMLQSKESLSSWFRPWLKLQLSRTEHRSS
jgi:hypothetical protein